MLCIFNPRHACAARVTVVVSLLLFFFYKNDPKDSYVNSLPNIQLYIPLYLNPIEAEGVYESYIIPSLRVL